MKVLFVIRSTYHFYYNRSIVEAFLRRGHNVEVLFEKEREKWTKGDYLAPLQNFKKYFPGFKYGRSHPRTDAWKYILMPARVLLNYRRYLMVEGQSQYFKERTIKYLPGFLSLLMRAPWIRRFLRSRTSEKFLHGIENRAGLDPAILKQIKNIAPDVVMVTVGGMRYGSMDLDYIKVARALGIPSVVSTLSWDSLSSKAFIQFQPDILLCWNDLHVAEAMEHHGIGPERTRTVGSPMFDSWFKALKPSTTREEFCKMHGLRPEDPIILYLGSPSTITADERPLMDKLQRALNEDRDARIGRAQMIFRPHPAHSKVYQNLENEIDGMKIIPKSGQLPDLPDSLQLFYDTLHHSVCAVGVNTSAMLESLIAAKPVVAMVRPEYRKTQSEAQHFKAMQSGGALYLANSMEGFLSMLKDFISGRDDLKENRKAFVRKYIRPRGLEKSAGENAVEEIEKLV